MAGRFPQEQSPLPRVLTHTHCELVREQGDAASEMAAGGQDGMDLELAVVDYDGDDEWEDEVSPVTPPVPEGMAFVAYERLAAALRTLSRTGEVSSAVPSKNGKDTTEKRHREASGRRCGRFTCTDDDIKRVSSRTRWLTGQNLSVFAESELRNSKSTDIAHIDSIVFWHVRRCLEALQHGQRGVAEVHRLLALVRSIYIVIRPPQARKWLITVHAENPQHWTLLEFNWQTRKIRFFDSFNVQSGYVHDIHIMASAFLDWCLHGLGRGTELGTWSWIGEQRPTRQSNSFDCGSFVAADIASLLRSDQPSAKTQAEMSAWRCEMAAQLRSLPAL